MKTWPVRVLVGHDDQDVALPDDRDVRPASSDAELEEVMQSLGEREPLFHRKEHGFARADFERMTSPDFHEIGASGRCYSRQFILDTLERRYASPYETIWEMGGFECRRIAADTFLVNYLLIQGDRRSRRATIWRLHDGDWQAVYHQGTLIQPE